MQIVLNLSNDSTPFISSFQDLMATLSPEDKKEMAKDILVQWLKDPYTVEMQTAHREAITYARSKESSYGTKKTDEELVGTYYYNEFLKTWKSSKVEMIETITKEAVAHMTTLITTQIKEDENLKEVYGKVQEGVAAGYKNMVQNAMQNFFIEMFKSNIPNLQYQVNNQQWGINDMRAKVGLQLL